MNSVNLYIVSGVILFSIGFYNFIMLENLLRKIVAFNITSTGVLLVLISVAYRNFSVLPDAVPHAMALTGIVVTISATSLALVIATHIFRDTGQMTLTQVDDQNCVNDEHE